MPEPGRRDASHPRGAALLVAFRVTVGSPDEDRASGILWDCETRGIEIRPATRGGAVDLIAYFETRPGLEDALADAFDGLPSAHIELVPIADVDWVAHVRHSFRALRAGGFRVVPAWLEPAPSAGPGTLIVDPGRAFGTGGHETTRLCLAALEAVAARSRLGRVLDLGAGSGILAIAALRLGARGASAIDVDPDAIASAAHHARLNGVSPSLLRGDAGRPFRPACFDTVVANLTAPLLCSRSAEIAALVRPGGSLILSGFLVEDASQVKEAYLPGGGAHLSTEGEWAALLL